MNNAMTANEIVQMALDGKALGVSIIKANKANYIFAITTFERGVDKIKVSIRDLDCLSLANLAAKSAAL